MGPRLALALLQAGQLRLVANRGDVRRAECSGLRKSVFAAPTFGNSTLSSIRECLKAVDTLREPPTFVRKLLSRDYNVFGLIGVGGILCAAMHDNIFPFD